MANDIPPFYTGPREVSSNHPSRFPAEHGDYEARVLHNKYEEYRDGRFVYGRVFLPWRYIVGA